MLQGYSEAIVDDIASSEEEKKEIAQVIYDESLRMGRLVNDLLDLARMEAGHISLNVEQVELREFFERVFRKFYGPFFLPQSLQCRQRLLHCTLEASKSVFSAHG